jgi:DNA-binding CsgD family transcriptional regulator
MKSYISRNSIVENNHSGKTMKLTARQKQIIELFCDELTTEQMADRLRFSFSTIKQDIIKIYSIFGVNTREQVVALAKKAGLLDSKKNS